jgi:hypothetical protein
MEDKSMKRAVVKVMTRTEAKNGRLLIRGAGPHGEVEIDFPGEVAIPLIGALFALSPVLAKVSASGTRPTFQMAGFELKKTTEPDVARLYLRCASPVLSGPATQMIDLGFSLSWDQVAEMGEKLAAAAKSRTPEPPRLRN